MKQKNIFPCFKSAFFRHIKQTSKNVVDTNFKVYLGSTSKAMADKEKKRGRQKYKNLNISRTKRTF